MVVEWDMEKITGMPDAGSAEGETDSFSSRLTREERSEGSGLIMEVTVKLRRTPR